MTAAQVVAFVLAMMPAARLSELKAKLPAPIYEVVYVEGESIYIDEIVTLNDDGSVHEYACVFAAHAD